MTVEFTLPDLGENIESGDVVSVLVAVGDSLDVDQSIVELETDKAVIEVPSSVAGTITAIHVKAGDKVVVGQSVLSVDVGAQSPVADSESQATEEGAEAVSVPVQEAESAPIAASPQQPAAAPPLTPSQFNLPDLGENTDGGDVVKVLVSVGDQLLEDQSILELETDKAVIEVPSSVSGRITEIHVAEGERASVGQPIITVEGGSSVPESPVPATDTARASAAVPDSAADAPETPPAKAQAPAPTAAAPGGALIPAAPSVRRLAREIGVDVSQVRGSGPGGRISEADVKAHSRQLHRDAPAPTTGGSGTAAPLPLPDFTRWGDVEREPMSNIRRVTAERLSAAWATIPHVTQFDRSDITDLEKWRKQYGKKVEAAGAKLTPTAIILKVVASALKAYPQFNASIDMQGQEIIYKKYCNVGVAVDTDRGLLVPVVRDVDQKNITDLAVELGEIAVKARDRKLSPDDMQGGCFTISNLGGIGGSGFTPIVNPPEVAILGVARGANEPVFIDGEFRPRMMLPLSLSYDHRIIDGADGARFLRWLCEALANPFLTLLEG